MNWHNATDVNGQRFYRRDDGLNVAQRADGGGWIATGPAGVLRHEDGSAIVYPTLAMAKAVLDALYPTRG